MLYIDNDHFRRRGHSLKKPKVKINTLGQWQKRTTVATTNPVPETKGIGRVNSKVLYQLQQSQFRRKDSIFWDPHNSRSDFQKLSSMLWQATNRIFHKTMSKKLHFVIQSDTYKWPHVRSTMKLSRNRANIMLREMGQTFKLVLTATMCLDTASGLRAEVPFR